MNGITISGNIVETIMIIVGIILVFFILVKLNEKYSIFFKIQKKRKINIREKNRIINNDIDDYIEILKKEIGDEKIFSKDVLEFCKDIIENEEKYIVNSYHIFRFFHPSGLAVWAANGIDNRRFETTNVVNNFIVNSEKAKELNTNMTYFDQILLDKIIKNLRKKRITLKEQLNDRIFNKLDS